MLKVATQLCLVRLCKVFYNPVLTIAVCGNPHFESAVRKGVQSSKRDIHLFVTGFRPEESEAGKIARGRYC